MFIKLSVILIVYLLAYRLQVARKNRLKTSVEGSVSSLPKISTEYRELGNKFTVLAKDSQHDKYFKPTAPSWESKQTPRKRMKRAIGTCPLPLSNSSFNWSQHSIARQSFRKDGGRKGGSEVLTGDFSFLCRQHRGIKDVKAVRKENLNTGYHWEIIDNQDKIWQTKTYHVAVSCFS